MEGLSDIETDIIHYDRFVFRGFVFDGKRRKHLHPCRIGQEKVHIAAHNRDVREVFGFRTKGIRDLFGNHLRGESGYFRIGEYIESEVPKLLFWWDIEGDLVSSPLSFKKRGVGGEMGNNANHYI